MSHTHENSELIQKVLSGTRWSAVLRISGQIFCWLGTIIVVRFINPEDYGLNTMLETPLVLMMLLSTFGLDVALVQSKKLEHAELRSIFGWLLVINALLFLAYFFGGTLISEHFNEPRLDTLAKVMAFIFLLAPFRVIPNALLDRELNFKLRAQVELTSTVISTVLTLVLAVLGTGVWALIGGALANRILQAILLMIFQPWFVLPTLDYANAHRLVVFGGITTLTGIASMLGSKVVVLTVGPQFGAELLGIYAVAMELAMLPLAKIMPILNQSLLPAFSKFQTQRDLTAYYMEKTLGIAALVILPMMIGMACVADHFVIAILGDKWSAAALPLALLSIMILFRMVTQLIKPVMTSVGRVDLSLMSSLLVLILIVPTSIFAIRYGIMGIVFAWLTTELLVMLVTVQISKRAVDTSFTRIFRSLWPAVLASSIMAVTVLGIKALFANLNEIITWIGMPQLSTAEQIDLLFEQADALVLLTGQVFIGAFTYWLVLWLFFAEHLKSLFTIVLGRKHSRNQVTPI